jgi:predicted DNA-binding transcriptional regulator
MVSKDQTIGGIICAVCVIVGILYTVGLFYYGEPFVTGWTIEFWLIAIPVFLAFIAIMGIGAWIGWTMATTPPPKPIEEITSEIEEKKEEEIKPEEKPAEAAPGAEEERRIEKRRKTEK